MDVSKNFIKIIQITDTHLFKNKTFSLNSVNTNSSFELIINKAKLDLIDSDAIFLTGDLSQDESKESYELISESLSKLNKKIFWIPGNHDSLINMRSVFNTKQNFYKEPVLLTPLWDFIFLNTKKNNQEYGYLPCEELLIIKNELSKNRKNPIAIVMHHHPVEVQTPLIDDYILQNREEFFKIVLGSNVNLIICGHVHNDYSFKYKNICIEAAPATCFQFKKNSSQFITENKIGYKIFHFTSTSYVAQTKFLDN